MDVQKSANSRMIRGLTLRDHGTGKRRVDCVPTPRSQIFHDRYQTEGQPKLPRLSKTHTSTNEAMPTISPPGAFGAHSGLHSLVVGPHNQQRKLSPPTKDSKPPRNEKDEGEDLEKTGESEKPSHVLGTCWISGYSGLGAVTVLFRGSRY